MWVMTALKRAILANPSGMFDEGPGRPERSEKVGRRNSRCLFGAVKVVGIVSKTWEDGFDVAITKNHDTFSIVAIANVAGEVRKIRRMGKADIRDGGRSPPPIIREIPGGILLHQHDLGGGILDATR